MLCISSFKAQFQALHHIKIKLMQACNGRDEMSDCARYWSINRCCFWAYVRLRPFLCWQISTNFYCK